jgi:hypothetical protein
MTKCQENKKFSEELMGSFHLLGHGPHGNIAQFMHMYQLLREHVSRCFLEGWGDMHVSRQNGDNIFWMILKMKSKLIMIWKNLLCTWQTFLLWRWPGRNWRRTRNINALFLPKFEPSVLHALMKVWLSNSAVSYMLCLCQVTMKILELSVICRATLIQYVETLGPDIV